MPLTPEITEKIFVFSKDNVISIIAKKKGLREVIVIKTNHNSALKK